jgi:hypothetical protein
MDENISSVSGIEDWARNRGQGGIVGDLEESCG